MIQGLLTSASAENCFTGLQEAVPQGDNRSLARTRAFIPYFIFYFKPCDDVYKVRVHLTAFYAMVSLSLVLIKKGQFSGALSYSVLPRIMLWRVRKSGLKSLSTSVRFPKAEQVMSISSNSFIEVSQPVIQYR